ncbi:YceI family protein [Streptomyces sp. MK7]|uniref:YceI family protein n=1 Tax=Streptomyces sp. MK7 TaxID=3067635 RepID=UPI00292EDDB6|nr:YceI family protein [Streptomyces sp. MK7]
MTTGVKSGAFHLDREGSTVAVRHKTMWGLVTVKGHFTTLSGDGQVRPDGTATGTVTVGSASLDTKNAKRDTHLRSADFFATDEFPEIIYEVREVTPRGETAVEVNGSLTVRGTTRPLTLTATVTEASTDAATLTTDFTVDRREFGLTWNQAGMMRDVTTVNAVLRFRRTQD